MVNDRRSFSKLVVPGLFSLTYLLFIIWMSRDCLQCTSRPISASSIPQLCGGGSHQWSCL